jgi:predicted DNA-binding antitoxin AbrB/MazE fold protein
MKAAPSGEKGKEMKIYARGTLKGQTIELDEPIDLPEGERVEVVVLWPEIVPVKRTTEELEAAKAEYEAMRDTPAYRTFNPKPPGEYVVTNEMVNRIRETMGF